MITQIILRINTLINHISVPTKFTSSNRQSGHVRNNKKYCKDFCNSNFLFVDVFLLTDHPRYLTKLYTIFPRSLKNHK